MAKTITIDRTDSVYAARAFLHAALEKLFEVQECLETEVEGLDAAVCLFSNAMTLVDGIADSVHEDTHENPEVPPKNTMN